MKYIHILFSGYYDIDYTEEKPLVASEDRFYLDELLEKINLVRDKLADIENNLNDLIRKWKEKNPTPRFYYPDPPLAPERPKHKSKNAWNDSSPMRSWKKKIANWQKEKEEKLQVERTWSVNFVEFKTSEYKKTIEKCLSDEEKKLMEEYGINYNLSYYIKEVPLHIRS